MDNYADLVVGAPHYDVNGVDQAGAVRILYGSGVGLSNSGSVVLTLNSAGLSGAPGSWDHFGSALAVGNFGRSAMPDLAIGIPGKEEYGGVVSVIYGGQNGPTPMPEFGSLYRRWEHFGRQAITSFPQWNAYDGFGGSLAPEILATEFTMTSRLAFLARPSMASLTAER